MALANAARRVDAWWMAPGSARTLALLRIAVGTFAVCYLAGRSPAFTSVARFDERRFEPTGVVNLLLDSPLPVPLADAILVLAIALSLAFALGYRFRVTAPLCALAVLWVTTYRSSWGQVFHSENLLVLHLAILAFAPAAASLSLDSRGKPPSGLRASAFGWPVRLMCAVTAITYFIAGWTKLDVGGLDWITTDALRNQVAYDNLRKILLGDPHSPLGGWLVAHEWVFTPLAALTLAVELGAPLALFWRRFTYAWVAAAWGFHLGIVATMAIIFPYPLFGIAFLPFLPLDRLSIPARARATLRSLALPRRARDPL